MSVKHPDYAILAGRIAASILHKQTKKKFSAVVSDLDNNISSETYNVVMRHAAELDSAIIYDRDFNYDYFGFKTMERLYLLRIGGKIAERPQHMIMRVAVGIHGDDVEKAIESYHLMSTKFFTHAAPTLSNAGSPSPHLAPCFLIHTENSITGIFDTLKHCAVISKSFSNFSLNIHDIQATKPPFRVSTGIRPILQLFNKITTFVDYSRNNQPGAFAIYLEPWHADIFDFLNMKKNQSEEGTCDLFYALWIPDLFMKRVELNGDWTLFCPDHAKDLTNAFGEDFERLYMQ
jgi:ribonucleoside-diphosphate reductase subunit M1